MQRRYNPAYFVLASVVLSVLTALVVGVDVHAQIAFVSSENGIADIYVMDADGGNRKNLTKNRHRHSSFHPSWSPDGKHIAFASDRDGNWEVYVMNTSGKNLKNLTSNRRDDHAPSWSPDGERIAFVSYRDHNWAEIYVMNANGKKIQNLTNSPRHSDWGPSWSPDGRYIAFDSGKGNSHIHVVHVEGGNPRKLSDNRWGDYSPSWSPDGKRIAFASKRNGNWDIYVMDADGGNFQNLTNSPLRHEYHPAWYSPPFAVEPAGKTFTMWGWLKQVAR